MRPILWAALAAAVVGLVSPFHCFAQEMAPPTVPLDDIERFQPRVPPSESDEDRIAATAHFAHGRLLFRREAYPGALRRYQRAYRYSENVRTILDEVVTLAFRLGRLDEATRYAQHLTPGTATDPFILRRLAMHLADRDEHAEALRLYQLMGGAETGSSAAGLITHFEMGRLNFLVNDFKQSAEHFHLVLNALNSVDALAPEERPIAEALEKEAVTTYSLIAEAFLEAGDVDDAENLFRRAYRSASDEILPFHLARVAMRRREESEALERLEQYFETNDTEAGTAPYELFVELLLKVANDANDATSVLAGAAARLNKLRTKQPKNVFLFYFLGELYLKNDQPDLALEVFEELMEIQPLLDGYRGIIKAHYQQAQPNAVLIRLVEAAGKLGDLGELSEVTTLVGRNDSFWQQMLVWSDDLRKGRIDLGPGKLSAQAVAQVLAEVAAAAGRAEEADRFFEQAADSVPTDRALVLAWGLERLASKRPERAAEVFRRLIDANGQQSQDAGLVYYYLSASLAMNDDFQAALEAAREAARLLPDIPAIQMRPAWVLYLAGHYDDSYQAYREFLQRFGASETDRDVVRDVKSSISALAVQMGRFLEAEEWLEQILDEVPDDAGALNDLGYLWTDRGVHLHRSLGMIQRAVEAEPKNLAYRDSLGWAFFRLGRLEESVLELRKAAEGEDPDGVILEHLGDALVALGDLDGAAEQWKRAIAALKATDTDRSGRIELKLKDLIGQP